MYELFFLSKDDLDISFRKLGYIEKYLHKYTKLYTDSLPNTEKDIDQKQFVAFFYILTVSAFYAYVYDKLPKKEIVDKQKNIKHEVGQGLSFITVNDIFNDQVENNKKKIHFYTTKKREEIFKLLKENSYSEARCFTIHFEYKGSDPSPQEALKSIFCSSEEYTEIVSEFERKNPRSYISSTQMIVPALFRLSILMSRIFLTQPIILEGDTECEKNIIIDASL